MSKEKDDEPKVDEITQLEDGLDKQEIVESKKEKKSIDIDKENKKPKDILDEQVELSKIDWSKIKFDDEEKHYPTVTDKDIEFFASLANFVIDKESLHGWCIQSRSQIEMVLEQRAMDAEYVSDGETEEERLERVKDTELYDNLYDSNRKFLAFIQEEVGKLESFVKEEKVIQHQIRNESMHFLTTYLFKELNGNDLKNVTQEEYDNWWNNNFKSKSILIGTLWECLKNENVSETINNIFCPKFIERCAKLKSYAIKTYMSEFVNRDDNNVDMNSIISFVNNNNNFILNITKLFELKKEIFYIPSKVSDDETEQAEIEKNKKEFFNIFDKDNLFTTLDSVSENGDGIMALKTEMVNLLISDKTIIDNIKTSLLTVIQNDKYLKRLKFEYDYENDIHNFITIIGTKVPKSINTDIAEWLLYYELMEKVFLYRDFVMFNEKIDDSTENIYFSHRFVSKFIEMYTNFIFLDFQNEYKEYVYGETKDKFITLRYTWFIITVFNVFKQVLCTCNTKEEADEMIEKYMNTYRIGSKDVDEKGNKIEDFLFDHFDISLAKKEIVEIIKTIMQKTVNMLTKMKTIDSESDEVKTSVGLINSVSFEEMYRQRRKETKQKSKKNRRRK